MKEKDRTANSKINLALAIDIEREGQFINSCLLSSAWPGHGHHKPFHHEAAVSICTACRWCACSYGTGTVTLGPPVPRTEIFSSRRGTSRRELPGLVVTIGPVERQTGLHRGTGQLVILW